MVSGPHSLASLFVGFSRIAQQSWDAKFTFLIALQLFAAVSLPRRDVNAAPTAVNGESTIGPSSAINSNFCCY